MRVAESRGTLETAGEAAAAASAAKAKRSLDIRAPVAAGSRNLLRRAPKPFLYAYRTGRPPTKGARAGISGAYRLEDASGRPPERSVARPGAVFRLPVGDGFQRLAHLLDRALLARRVQGRIV